MRWRNHLIIQVLSPPTEDLHQETLLAMVHDSLSQPEILDSSDIIQLLSVNKSTTHKDYKNTVKVHRQYVFARANKGATQLINRGANGGLTGSYMCVCQKMSCKINIVGINDHELTGLPIVTASMVIETNQYPIVGIFFEYAHLRQGSSIHASSQLKWFHIQVEKCSKIVSGQQHLVTQEGYTIPISINSRLTFIHPPYVAQYFSGCPHSGMP